MMGHHSDKEVRKGPSDKMMYQPRLEGRKGAAYMKSYGKGEPAEDLCKGPESRESVDFSKNRKKPSKTEAERQYMRPEGCGLIRDGVWISL